MPDLNRWVRELRVNAAQALENRPDLLQALGL